VAIDRREDVAGPTYTLNVAQDLPMPRVREFLRGVDHGLPERVRNSPSLLVTEVASNAQRHGDPPVVLEVTWLAGTARAAVRSGGPNFGWQGRGPSPGQNGGWGLVFVEDMADRWGIRRLADGNEVWMELDH